LLFRFLLSEPRFIATVRTRKEEVMAIDDRHRDRNGEISRKHGNTLVRTLRKHYGANFAKRCQEDERLSDLLQKIDEPSLSQLIHDHAGGKLEQICKS
jgi:hypothetical protein